MKANCPTCKKEVIFASSGGYYKFVKYGRQCRSCSKKKPPHSESELTRYCSQCGKKKIYKSIGDKNAADKCGHICRSCASRKFNGMKGRHLSEEHIKAISGKNHYNYGKKLPEEVKEKIRNKLKGENNPFYGKNHDAETWKTIVEKNKTAIRPKTSEETKLKQRKARLKWLDEIGAYGENGKSYNKIGCKYLDELSQKMGWEIQHAMNGGEIQIAGYSVDGFDKNRNIVVEYDEPKHYDGFGNLREKDVERMNRIIKECKCKFYRYNEKTQTLKEYQV